VRKFKRKPKKGMLQQEEMVISPIEYPVSQVDKEELYRRYFFYWKSWHDELIVSFDDALNRKKQTECFAEAIKNLNELKPLLKKEKQDIVESFIRKLEELQVSLDKDTYNFDALRLKSRAERLRKDISLELSPSKIKESLL